MYLVNIKFHRKLEKHNPFMHFDTKKLQEIGELSEKSKSEKEKQTNAFSVFLAKKERKKKVAEKRK